MWVSHESKLSSLLNFSFIQTLKALFFFSCFGLGQFFLFLLLLGHSRIRKHMMLAEIWADFLCFVFFLMIPGLVVRMIFISLENDLYDVGI